MLNVSVRIKKECKCENNVYIPTVITALSSHLLSKELDCHSNSSYQWTVDFSNHQYTIIK